MKKLFYKIMTSFHRPIKRLSDQEIATIIIQYSKYRQREIECLADMALADTFKEHDDLNTERVLIRDRMSSLKVKLLKSCDCGRDHTEDIESEANRKEIFLKQLLKGQ